MIHKGDGCEKGVHQSYLGTEKNAPVISKWFQPCQCCCRPCYPGAYLRLGTLVTYITEPRYLKLVTVSGFCVFDLLADAAGVVCHQLGLLGTDLHDVGCGGFVEMLSEFCQSFLLSDRIFFFITAAFH